MLPADHLFQKQLQSQPNTKNLNPGDARCDLGLVDLLGSLTFQRKEWALGNVAGDSPKCRDLVLNNNAMTPLLAQLNENAVLSMLRTATWTLSTFCRGKPQPNFEQVCMRVLCRHVDTDFGRWYPSPNVLIPALRTVGNIVTGDDVQTQENLKRNNNGALPYLLHLLTNVYNKKDACWTISSMELLANAEFDIKKEAMQPLATEKDPGNTGSINIYAKFIDEAEGLEKIETHDNNEIYDKVIKILNSYWVEEDEENVAPGVAPAPICIRESRSFGNVPSGGFNSDPPGEGEGLVEQQRALAVSYLCCLCLAGRAKCGGVTVA
ncbi:importin subunit alpha-1 [Selaginella moellendorffii]|uniref:importin subunit alpha-1 n=1 Tax=Selaginella moellendorffii TaxID=88036 RepID=UPI000D1CFA97|nr:importin subunit alpha-1 [Selaginella moellendorffii]|eukprot:XP_024527852.1 importin subunit alpha-1 [Selaginella moellendorffii]